MNFEKQRKNNIMKKTYLILIIFTVFFGSCTKDLLNQLPPDNITSDMFWDTVDDAKRSVSGVYAAMRNYFGVDYQHDANVDICYGQSYGNETGSPDGFRSAWDGCYKIINQANVSLEGIRKMKPQTSNDKDKATLVNLEAEARFLRAMAYSRLVDFFGAVPYLYKTITHEEAIQLERIPVTQVRDSILADLDFSIATLPVKYDASNFGRATKWAAISYRGKFNLYWACWLKNQRPEWSALNEQYATYYTKARDDFKTVMQESDHALFKGGDPGEYADPNYRQLFSIENESCNEIIFSAQFTGPRMNLGSQMKAVFSSRQGGNNGAIQPTIKLMDMYLKLDGTKAEALVPSKNTTLKNSATNRVSYKGRDWRMHASILWDGEKLLMQNAEGTTFAKDSANFLWGNKGTGSLDDPYYDYYNHKAGYAFRKWMPTYLGYDRYDCPQDFYLVRYADVLLMYCEAVNEINNGANAELQTIVNLLRHRGNIAPSNTIAGMNKQDFFDLLVNERAIEFVAEGQRFFDIRRWRLAEKIWNNGIGFTLTDSWGVKVQDEFVNAQFIQFQRFYIMQIPPSEIIMNSKIVQNDPWL